MPAAVHRLFRVCREVFSNAGNGGVPSPEDVERIKSILAQPPGVQLAKVKADTILTAPCDTSILYPESGGNMHCFVAVTACAVLDVLGPPYSDAESRPCTYYNAYSYEKFAGDTNELSRKSDEYAWLEEREKPEDLVVQGGKYHGPKF